MDKYLAAIRRQVELIAEVELTKKPSPRKAVEKKPTHKDRRKHKKDDDETESDPDDKQARKEANKNKPCFMFRQGACAYGDKCQYLHEPNAYVYPCRKDAHRMECGRSADQAQRCDGGHKCQPCVSRTVVS